jgi:hypothetical protein
MEVRDVLELLRNKEQELEKVKRQVEALRIALPLLEADDPSPALRNNAAKRDHGFSA